MEQVLANLLLSYAPLKAMVGTAIAWNISSQGVTGPRIVMTLISQPHDYTMAGKSGLVEARVQFDCRTNKRSGVSPAAEVRTMAEHLDALLSGYRGKFASIRFAGIFKQGHRTSADVQGAIETHTASVDYIIWWKPA